MCAICRSWVSYWQHLTNGRVVYRPYQDAAADFPAIPHEAFERPIWLGACGGAAAQARQIFFADVCRLCRGGQRRSPSAITGPALAYELRRLTRCLRKSVKRERCSAAFATAVGFAEAKSAVASSDRQSVPAN